jgi:tRNA-specific 2-thiouridylase
MSLADIAVVKNTPTRSKTIVAVAMSGGVDSSVAAALLVEQGYEVVGLTMHLWTDPKGEELALNRASGCCSITMSRDAASVAERLGFPHYVLNLSREFHSSVVENFGHEYLAGRTPNPCVRCNTFVKWQTLLERARRMGCDYLATGHYARAIQGEHRVELRRAKHQEKDQSYALWGLSQANLSRTLFPLGELSKVEVRALAMKLGLKNADKPESQDICFVPDDDYRRFLGDNFGSELRVLDRGEIIGPAQKVLGYHSGVANFTIGQRKGLGISADRPLYVTRIEPDSNRVFVDYDENCFGRSAIVNAVNWVSIAQPSEPFECAVKIRYRDTPHLATLHPRPNGTVGIQFHEQVRAITPGQSAVFYDEELVLGGGVLSNLEDNS